MPKCAIKIQHFREWRLNYCIKSYMLCRYIHLCVLEQYICTRETETNIFKDCVCVCVCILWDSCLKTLRQNPLCLSKLFGVNRRIYIHVLVVTADSIKHCRRYAKALFQAKQLPLLADLSEQQNHCKSMSLFNSPRCYHSLKRT